MDMGDTSTFIIFPDGIDDTAKIQILQLSLNQSKRNITALLQSNAERGQACSDIMRRLADHDKAISEILPLIEKLKFALIAVAAVGSVALPLGLLWLQKLMQL